VRRLRRRLQHSIGLLGKHGGESIEWTAETLLPTHPGNLNKWVGIIETLSADITLLPGDVIATGTLAGAGIGFRPTAPSKKGMS
jgi:hypothetical protein